LSQKASPGKKRSPSKKCTPSGKHSPSKKTAVVGKRSRSRKQSPSRKAGASKKGSPSKKRSPSKRGNPKRKRSGSLKTSPRKRKRSVSKKCGGAYEKRGGRITSKHSRSRSRSGSRSRSRRRADACDASDRKDGVKKKEADRKDGAKKGDADRKSGVKKKEADQDAKKAKKQKRDKRSDSETSADKVKLGDTRRKTKHAESSSERIPRNGRGKKDDARAVAAMVAAELVLASMDSGRMGNAPEAASKSTEPHEQPENDAEMQRRAADEELPSSPLPADELPPIEEPPPVAEPPVLEEPPRVEGPPTDIVDVAPDGTSGAAGAAELPQPASPDVAVADNLGDSDKAIVEACRDGSLPQSAAGIPKLAEDVDEDSDTAEKKKDDKSDAESVPNSHAPPTGNARLTALAGDDSDMDVDAMSGGKSGDDDDGLESKSKETEHRAHCRSVGGEAISDRVLEPPSAIDCDVLEPPPAHVGTDAMTGGIKQGREPSKDRDDSEVEKTTPSKKGRNEEEILKIYGLFSNPSVAPNKVSEPELIVDVDAVDAKDAKDGKDAKVAARHAKGDLDGQPMANPGGAVERKPPVLSPKTIVLGEKLHWWSSSQKKLCPVRVTKVSEGKRVVIITFEEDSNVWKSVPFSMFGTPDCPLRPPPGWKPSAAVGGGGASADVSQGGKGQQRSGSATPEWWKQEKEKMMEEALQEQLQQKALEDEKRRKELEERSRLELRRKELLEAEKRKVEAAFEQRKREAEERQLKEEEEWRQRLRAERELEVEIEEAEEAALEEEREAQRARERADMEREKEERRKRRRDERAEREKREREREAEEKRIAAEEEKLRKTKEAEKKFEQACMDSRLRAAAGLMQRDGMEAMDMERSPAQGFKGAVPPSAPTPPHLRALVPVPTLPQARGPVPGSHIRVPPGMAIRSARPVEAVWSHPTASKGAVAGPMAGKGGVESPMAGKGTTDGPMAGKGLIVVPRASKGSIETPMASKGAAAASMAGKGAAERPMAGKGAAAGPIGGKGAPAAPMGHHAAGPGAAWAGRPPSWGGAGAYGQQQPAAIGARPPQSALGTTSGPPRPSSAPNASSAAQGAVPRFAAGTRPSAAPGGNQGVTKSGEHGCGGAMGHWSGGGSAYSAKAGGKGAGQWDGAKGCGGTYGDGGKGGYMSQGRPGDMQYNGGKGQNAWHYY